MSVPLSVCCGVLLSGFSSFSAGSALLCCCGFMVVCFLTRSNLRFLSQRGFPLGQVSLASASVFLGFELPAYAVSFLFCLLCSSALFASGILLVSCSPCGLRLISLVLGLVRCCFFPETFLVPTRSCSFRPSSGSSFLCFRCSSLRFLLPF